MIDTIAGLQVVYNDMNEFKKTNTFHLRMLAQAMKELQSARELIAIQEGQIYEMVKK